jgi:hypothetical protein
MIFYIALDEHGHRQLCGTQADAKAINKNFEQIDIPTDKTGLMGFVQTLFHNNDTLCDQLAELDNLRHDLTSSMGRENDLLNDKPSYVDQSVNWDALFPTLPLAHQLHFAAMAMENARERL